MVLFANKSFTTAIVSVGLAMVFVQPVLAKHSKTAPAAPLTDEQSVQTPIVGNGKTAAQMPASNMSAKVLQDAIELCQLVADNKREIIDVMEAGGWASEIDYNAGNAPFYKELSAELTYEGVGDAELWGFIEDYPGYKIGYCSLSVASPPVVFDLSAINDLEGMVGELIVEDDTSFGAWRADASPEQVAQTFIHAYQNNDTFLYQITVIGKFDQ